MKILYIPGLGEGFVLAFQKRYISLLNVFRSEKNKIIVFDSLWESDEQFDHKIDRLQEKYNEYAPEIIVGPSAGGALSINLLSRNTHIVHCYVVCAKMRGSEKIGEAYSRRAPALIDAVIGSEKSLKNIQVKNVTAYVSKEDYDGIVEKEDMFISGMEVITMPVKSHGRAILYWLLRRLPRL